MIIINLLLCFMCINKPTFYPSVRPSTSIYLISVCLSIIIPNNYYLFIKCCGESHQAAL